MTGGMVDPSRGPHRQSQTRVPALAVWSLVLTLLPAIVALISWIALTVGVPEPTETWAHLVFDAIPAVWIAAFVVGVVTVAIRRNGGWRGAGVLAIVLAIVQSAACVIIFTFLSTHPI